MGLYEDRVKRLHDHVMIQQKKAEGQSKQEPNKDEIMAMLDELGIEYNKRANKATLLELLVAAQKENDDTGEDLDDGEGAE